MHLEITTKAYLYNLVFLSYSYLKASTGSMREARIAGSNPEITPMNVVNATTPMISHSGNDMKLLIDKEKI